MGLPARSQTPTLSIIAVVFIVLAAIAFPHTASAHARLVRSNPISGTASATMPEEITLQFSEEIEPAFSSANLLDAEGAEFALGDIRPTTNNRQLSVLIADSDSAPPGTYTLVWRVLSAIDGHVTTGTVAFSAGTGVAPTSFGAISERPPWWRVAIRWLVLSGLTLSTGLFLFARLVAQQHVTELPNPTRRLAISSAAVLLAALVVSAYDLGVAATAARFVDPPPLDRYRALLDSADGRALLVAAFASSVMLALMFLNARGRLLAVIGGGAGFAALFAVSSAGHAAAAPSAWRAVLTDWMHFSAVAGWLGILPYLWLATGMTGTDRAVELILRFARVALATLGLVIASGFVRAIWEVDGPRTLVETDYGRVLIFKHLLVVPILIAAGTNRLVLVPRLRPLGDGPLIGTIRHVLAIELAAALFILLAAATLTELAPANGPLPVDVASRPVTIDQIVAAGDLDIRLVARLNGTPDDRYTLAVSGPDGQAPPSLQRVIIATRTSADGTDVADRFDAEPLAETPGTFSFPAVRLGLPGVWNLAVTVRRAGLDDVEGSLSVDTSNTGVRPPRLVDDDWRLPRPTVPAWLFGFLSLASLLGGVYLVGKLRGLEPLAAAILLTMTAVIVAGFAVQGYRQTVPVSAGTDLTNPTATTSSSLRRANDLYRSLCLECHGADGSGVGNDDPEHTHAGSNLRDDRTQEQRDGDLFWTITHGVGGTEMPAYDTALTEHERWELVTYLRALDGVPATPEADS